MEDPEAAASTGKEDGAPPPVKQEEAPSPSEVKHEEEPRDPLAQDEPADANVKQKSKDGDEPDGDEKDDGCRRTRRQNQSSSFVEAYASDDDQRSDSDQEYRPREPKNKAKSQAAVKPKAQAAKRRKSDYQIVNPKIPAKKMAKSGREANDSSMSFVPIKITSVTSLRVDSGAPKPQKAKAAPRLSKRGLAEGHEIVKAAAESVSKLRSSLGPAPEGEPPRDADELVGLAKKWLARCDTLKGEVDKMRQVFKTNFVEHLAKNNCLSLVANDSEFERDPSNGKSQVHAPDSDSDCEIVDCSPPAMSYTSPSNVDSDVYSVLKKIERQGVSWKNSKPLTTSDKVLNAMANSAVPVMIGKDIVVKKISNTNRNRGSFFCLDGRTLKPPDSSVVFMALLTDITDYVAQLSDLQCLDLCTLEVPNIICCTDGRHFVVDSIKKLILEECESDIIKNSSVMDDSSTINVKMLGVCPKCAIVSGTFKCISEPDLRFELPKISQNFCQPKSLFMSSLESMFNIYNFVCGNSFIYNEFKDSVAIFKKHFLKILSLPNHFTMAYFESYLKNCLLNKNILSFFEILMKSNQVEGETSDDDSLLGLFSDLSESSTYNYEDDDKVKFQSDRNTPRKLLAYNLISKRILEESSDSDGSVLSSIRKKKVNRLPSYNNWSDSSNYETPTKRNRFSKKGKSDKFLAKIDRMLRSDDENEDVSLKKTKSHRIFIKTNGISLSDDDSNEYAKRIRLCSDQSESNDLFSSEENISPRNTKISKGTDPNKLTSNVHEAFSDETDGSIVIDESKPDCLLTYLEDNLSDFENSPVLINDNVISKIVKPTGLFKNNEISSIDDIKTESVTQNVESIALSDSEEISLVKNENSDTDTAEQINKLSCNNNENTVSVIAKNTTNSKEIETTVLSDDEEISMINNKNYVSETNTHTVSKEIEFTILSDTEEISEIKDKDSGTSKTTEKTTKLPSNDKNTKPITNITILKETKTAVIYDQQISTISNENSTPKAINNTVLKEIEFTILSDDEEISVIKDMKSGTDSTMKTTKSSELSYDDDILLINDDEIDEVKSYDLCDTQEILLVKDENFNTTKTTKSPELSCDNDSILLINDDEIDEIISSVCDAQEISLIKDGYSNTTKTIKSSEVLCDKNKILPINDENKEFASKNDTISKEIEAAVLSDTEEISPIIVEKSSDSTLEKNNKSSCNNEVFLINDDNSQSSPKICAVSTETESIALTSNQEITLIKDENSSSDTTWIEAKSPVSMCNNDETLNINNNNTESVTNDCAVSKQIDCTVSSETEHNLSSKNKNPSSTPKKKSKLLKLFYFSDEVASEDESDTKEQDLENQGTHEKRVSKIICPDNIITLSDEDSIISNKLVKTVEDPIKFTAERQISKTRMKITKKRKRIRKIISDDMLESTTKRAVTDEINRLNKLSIKREKTDQYFRDFSENLHQHEKFQLDYDAETGEEIFIHPDISNKLELHQLEGVKFMWDSCFDTIKSIRDGSSGSGCILAHCMGLGKTLQVIALLHSILTSPSTLVRTVLICCPRTVILNWVDEFNKWLSCEELNKDIRVYKIIADITINERKDVLNEWNKKGGVLITGYNMFKNLCNQSKGISYVSNTLTMINGFLLNPGPDLVICDEGHHLKNKKTVLVRTMKKIRTKRRIVLTGTPLQNNLKEYYCMVSFIKPRLLGTHKEFKNRFVNPITNGQHRDSTNHDIKIMKKRSHVLHKMLDGCLQRKEASILYEYLPSKREYVLFVTLSNIQAKLYESYLKKISCSLLKNTKNLFSDRDIFQKIWTHPVLLPKDISEEISFNGTDITISHKLFVVFSIMNECTDLGEKLIIFSSSLKTLNLIQNILTSKFGWKINIDFYRMDGNVSEKNRKTMCDNFNCPTNTTIKLMLLSIKVGGIGINLVGANRAIIMDVSWNPAQDLQSIFRIYRFGQTKNCFIYRLVSQGTMEEKIYERSVTKEAVSCRVVDEQQIDRHYSIAELHELYTFKHIPDTPQVPIALPSDQVLAQALLNLKNNSANQKVPIVWSVHEHDSLLRDIHEEQLNDSERREAWIEYEAEKLRVASPLNLPDLQHRKIIKPSSKQTKSSVNITPTIENDISMSTLPPNKEVSECQTSVNTAITPNNLLIQILNKKSTLSGKNFNTNNCSFPKIAPKRSYGNKKYQRSSTAIDLNQLLTTSIKNNLRLDTSSNISAPSTSKNINQNSPVYTNINQSPSASINTNQRFVITHTNQHFSGSVNVNRHPSISENRIQNNSPINVNRYPSTSPISYQQPFVSVNTNQNSSVPTNLHQYPPTSTTMNQNYSTPPNLHFSRSNNFYQHPSTTNRNQPLSITPNTFISTIPNKCSSIPIISHQSSSTVINSYQRASEPSNTSPNISVLNTSHCLSTSTNINQHPYVPVILYQQPSAPINVNQGLSTSKSSYQRPSELTNISRNNSASTSTSLCLLTSNTNQHPYIPVISHQRPSAPMNVNQSPSTSKSSYQRPSESTNTSQNISASLNTSQRLLTLNTNQRPYIPPISHQRPSAPINVNQGPSTSKSSYQRPSESTNASQNISASLDISRLPISTIVNQHRYLPSISHQRPSAPINVNQRPICKNSYQRSSEPTHTNQNMPDLDTSQCLSTSTNINRHPCTPTISLQRPSGPINLNQCLKSNDSHQWPSTRNLKQHISRSEIPNRRPQSPTILNHHLSTPPNTFQHVFTSNVVENFLIKTAKTHVSPSIDRMENDDTFSSVEVTLGEVTIEDPNENTHTQ